MNCCYLFQCERRPPQENEKDSDEEPTAVEVAPEQIARAEEEAVIPPAPVNNP